jgi:glyoxylase-like metal-dependent hydrolase (beta-lactamase superfamily II)
MHMLQDLEEKAATRAPSWPHPVAGDIGMVRTGFVNLFLCGSPGAPSGSWVLVDGGLPGSASLIVRAAREWIGPWARPAAFILTHGHFDHVGSLPRLAELWDVPVFAHRLELPYLTGRASYPPPDPTVGGGAISALSWLYPRGPFNFGNRIRALPDDGTVPFMPGWRWVPTPGHSPGHVSLFREKDRTLIAGDAVVTTRQESALAAITYRPELHGPPKYFTPDWGAARRSVARVAELEPELLVTGHGPPLQGPGVARQLHRLARDFERVAVPARGRYVGRPAVTDERGVVSVPPSVGSPIPRALLAIGAGLLLGNLFRRSFRGTQ